MVRFAEFATSREEAFAARGSELQQALGEVRGLPDATEVEVWRNPQGAAGELFRLWNVYIVYNIYIYIHIYVHIYIYTYIYIYRLFI